MIKINEVNIQFVKPIDGLVAFASVVLNGQFYLGSIGIHQKLDGSGYRLTYPTKKGHLINRPVFHPITHEAGQSIERAILTKLSDVMSKNHDRHHCTDIE